MKKAYLLKGVVIDKVHRKSGDVVDIKPELFIDLCRAEKCVEFNPAIHSKKDNK